jgi:CBS domain-containing protein
MIKARTNPQRAVPDNSSFLVAQMMTPGVVQVPGDVSVSEAALLMQKERVPCLLVKDTDSRFGIMTPNDIVRKVVAQGLEPQRVEARAIMSRPVRSVEYNRLVEDASTLMASTGVPLLIVTRDSQPVGILTAQDLVLAPKRCDTYLPATISLVTGEETGAAYEGTITQLSHVGAYVETAALLLPGTNVTLQFSLPGMAPSFSARGTIMSSYDPPPVAHAKQRPRSPGVDIQFAQSPPAEESKLRAWVLQNFDKTSDHN